MFAVILGWLPAIGAGEADDPGDQVRRLILPAFAIGVGWVGYTARLVRAAMLETLNENHVRTYRAFGVSDLGIALRYVLPIAMVPVVAVLGVGMGSLLSGAVLVEVVFARPGLGSLAHDAVMSRNFPVLLGTVVVTTALYRDRQSHRRRDRRPCSTPHPAGEREHGARHRHLPCPSTALSRGFSGLAGVFRRIVANPLGAISLSLVVALIVCALFAPLIAPYDPIALNPRIRLQGRAGSIGSAPTRLGRDVLSRLIYGTGTALRVARARHRAAPSSSGRRWASSRRSPRASSTAF